MVWHDLTWFDSMQTQHTQHANICNPRSSAAATPCIGGCWLCVSSSSAIFTLHPEIHHRPSSTLRPTSDFVLFFLQCSSATGIIFTLPLAWGKLALNVLIDGHTRQKAVGLRLTHTTSCMYDHICIDIYIMHIHVCVGFKCMCIWAFFSTLALETCMCHSLWIAYLTLHIICYRTHVDMSKITITNTSNTY